VEDRQLELRRGPQPQAISFVDVFGDNSTVSYLFTASVYPPLFQSSLTSSCSHVKREASGVAQLSVNNVPISGNSDWYGFALS